MRDLVRRAKERTPEERRKLLDDGQEYVLITEFIQGGHLMCQTSDIEMQRGVAVVDGDSWVHTNERGVIDLEEVA